MLNFFNYLNKDKDINFRKYNILKFEKIVKNNLFLNINDHFLCKYNLPDDFILTKKELKKTTAFIIIK